jgi:hypothetical protein
VIQTALRPLSCRPNNRSDHLFAQACNAVTLFTCWDNKLVRTLPIKEKLARWYVINSLRHATAEATIRVLLFEQVQFLGSLP